MKILIVCSGNAPNFEFEKHQAFIYDQVEAIKKVDVTISFDYFFINQKGIKGYLSCLKNLRTKISKNSYQCVHAHFVMSSLLANLQRKAPVITTFHGSDINLKWHRWVSMVVALMSKKVIYVSQQIWNKSVLQLREKTEIIPCGIDFWLFTPYNKQEAKKIMGLLPDRKYVLFSSNFGNKVKNPELAQKAIAALANSTVVLLELKNYTRTEVALLMNATDVALMTSFSEGSPQFIKEALACNRPVISTDVGDVRSIIENVEGCYISTYDPQDVAQKLKQALQIAPTFQSRHKIQNFDNQLIASQVINIYKNIQSSSI